MIGVIQRVIRFQFFATLNGITGWMFRTFWTRLSGPMPKFQLSWKGTLMRLAMGFCAAFLSSSAFVAAAGVSSVATWVPAGSTGVSWAKSGTVDRKRTVTAPKTSPCLFDRFIAVHLVFRSLWCTLLTDRHLVVPDPNRSLLQAKICFQS